MPNYNVILQPLAKVDLDDAYQYLESQKADLGFDLMAEIADILQVLEDNPFLYQKIDGKRRRAITRKFRYNILYIVDDNNVIILAILHGKKDINRFLD